MGAHDCVEIYRDMTPAQVRKRWAADQENAAIEDGRGAYSGTIATMRGQVQFYDKRFATQNEAYEFCLDKHQKREPGIACSFLIAKEATAADRRRVAKAEEKVVLAMTTLSTANRKAREAFFGQKSKKVGCKGCTSSLNRAKLNEMRLTPLVCPLCKTDLLAAATRTKLEKLKAKLASVREAAEASRKTPPSKKIGWCVGGWAAS